MRAHDIRLRGGEFRIGVLGIYILSRPDHRLTHSHAEEILPAHGFFMGVLEGFCGDHMDRAASRFNLFDERVVTKTGWGRVMIDVFAHHLLGVFVPF